MLFTKVGFFSVVQCSSRSAHESEAFPKLTGGLTVDDVLSVRARVEGDLDELRKAYAPKLGPTIMLPGRDYPYRAYIIKEHLSEAMVRAVLDLDYGNFKSMVEEKQGRARHDLYSEVWGVMYKAEQKLTRKKR